MKKKIGLGLILLAIMMLAFYFVYLTGLEQKNDNDVLNYIDNTRIQEQKVDEEIKRQEVEENPKSSYQINYTAVLEIPKIHLKRGVVNNTKNFNSINYAISVDNSSNYPDVKGNFVLYAHSGNSPIGYFSRLIDININDDIYVYFNGIKYHYSIFEKYDIEKNGKAKVLSSKDSNYITLITCNQKRKGYQLVLVGKLVNQINY